jgi:uncharacterized protein YndB with AHSA1/START domain
MGTIHAEASGTVNAPPQRVYDFLRDYRTNHPSILPPQVFKNYLVELGGEGAGTVVRFDMHAGGRVRGYRMEVSEPEPGRRLVESDTRSSAVTAFACAPLENGARTRLTITTEWKSSGGVGGFFERTFAPRVLRGIYEDELRRIDAALAKP